MKIVADRNLALTEQDIPPTFELVKVEGRELRKEQLQDADVLLVRSVTTVNASLLLGTPVRFVGTATAGLDHLDTEFLRENQINYCAAPGCNAEAVVDYCLAALAHCRLALGLDVESSTVGIVGAGNVGSRLCNRLRKLGCSVVLNDPPLQASAGADFGGLPLQPLERLRDCQIISLHVPLTTQGQHPTQELIGKDFLAALPESCLLLNTCRGDVVAESALLERVKGGHLHTVIDVWRNEPDVDVELVSSSTLATPHIAGYSALAKRRGIQQVLNQLWPWAVGEGKLQSLPVSTGETAADPVIQLDPGNYASYWDATIEVLPMEQLSQEFKQLAQASGPGQGFDQMRKELQQRREFSEYGIAANGLTEDEQAAYRSLGFQLLR